MRESIRHERLVVYLLLAGIVLLYLTGLTAVGIFDPEEGRHVSVATAMLRTGDIVVPQLQGFPYLEKPPLAYWLIALSFRALGRGEFSARLPAAAMGLLGVAAVGGLARIVLGFRAALLSATVLALSTQWFLQSRYMTTDMILSGWITVALAAFYVAFHTRRHGFYLLFFFAMAMATLAKGILGVVLPCGAVGVFVAWTRRWSLLAEMRPVKGAALFAAIVLPWFFLVERRIPEFLHYFVVDQHVARFVGSAQEHPAPVWFFVPVVAFGFFPWIAHVPGAASLLGDSRDLPAFLGSWFGVVFVFFSIAQEKLMGYILPAYPPLAILVGGYLATLWDSRRAADTKRRVSRASLVTGAGLVLLSPLFIVGLRRFMAADGRLSISEIGAWPWALASLYAVAGSAQILLSLRRRARSALLVAALAQVLAFATFVGGAAAADVELGTRPIGERLARETRPDDAVVLYRAQQPSLEYYLGRPPLLFGWTGELAWGMKVRPDPGLAAYDPLEIEHLLSSPRTVWLVTRTGDRAAETELHAPLELVFGNRKRTVYRNHAGETR